MVKNLLSLLIVLLILPAAGADECDDIEKEMESLQEQAQGIMSEAAGKKNVIEASREAEAKLKPLMQKLEALNKRFSECRGITTTKQRTQSKAPVQAEETTLTDTSTDPGAANNPEIFSNATQPLITMNPMPDAETPPTPDSDIVDFFPSSRTREEKAAALAAVNAELDRLPYILPRKENAPSKDAILKLAANRNDMARKRFSPDELSVYSQAVHWVPRFDGVSRDAEKARQLSLLVSSVTNYFNTPHFVIALASAVFSLDAQSVSAANNLASAIITAGERLYPDDLQAKELAPFRADSESCFLYALATSMDGDAWTDASLTSLINLGNLYIDMGRLEEARSLFQAARKQSPYSWDAALGMAAYFHAVKQPDKALAILEDENLDRPQTLLVAQKRNKVLEKNDVVPIDSPEQVYEDRLKSINSGPIATAADFVSQIDQSTRNQMRYFLENLAPRGSFKAPSITKLTQYASIRAVSSPHGMSALQDFQEMVANYYRGSISLEVQEQLDLLSRLGIELNSNVDLNDLVRNPEKYSGKKPKVTVDKKSLNAAVANLRSQAMEMQQGLSARNMPGLITTVSQINPFVSILLIDPEEYADPMNVVIQKMNFAVYQRKTSLYKGYFHSVNKRTREAVTEIATQLQRILKHNATAAEAKLKELESRHLAGEISDADYRIMRHRVHQEFYNACNGASEGAFGSATNVATTAYIQKIKPKVEAYYYDVIRHISLISDPLVRNQKDAELRKEINSALVYALTTVGIAYGSFKYSESWECGCELEELLRAKEAAQAAREEEENRRIQRNKAAKVAFDSGEIPDSTPLFKKLDSYGVEFDYFFFKGKVTCARTVVTFDLTIPFVPGAPQITASKAISEFTGSAKFDQGIRVGIGSGGKGGQANVFLDLSSSVSTDGQGVVKDYSITAATGLSVSASGTTVSVGGSMTFGPNGVTDSDFSAGINTDFPIGRQYTGNDVSFKGNISLEASVKRGCKLSGAVNGTLNAVKGIVDDIKENAMLSREDEARMEDPSKTAAERAQAREEAKASASPYADLIPTDEFLKKKLWAGPFWPPSAAK